MIQRCQPIDKRLRQLSRESSTDEFLAANVNVITEERLQNMLSVLKRKIISEFKEYHSRLIDSVETRVLDLENENIQLKSDNISLTYKVCKLVEENERLHGMVQEARLRSVENEQYSRKSNLKIYGIPEDENGGPSENTRKVVLNMFNTKLGVALREKDIDASHRVGRRKKSGSMPRSIIVKFLRIDDKRQVIKQGKKLKGSKIVVSDDMSMEMMKVFNWVKNDSRFKDAWTWEGKIFGKDHRGRIHRVRYGDSFENLLYGQQSEREELREICEESQLMKNESQNKDETSKMSGVGKQTDSRGINYRKKDRQCDIKRVLMILPKDAILVEE